MVMAGNNGYDENFVDGLPDHLKCIVCHLAFREPVQIAACGHRFCGKCFKNMKDFYSIRNEKFCCPIDRTEIDTNQVFRDKAAGRQVLSLKVKCSNTNAGCKWTGELCDLKKHVHDICMYEKIECSNIDCSILVERRYHQQHVDSCTLTDSLSSTASSTVQSNYMELVMQRVMRLEQSVAAKLAEKDREIEELNKRLKNANNNFDDFKTSIASRLYKLEEDVKQCICLEDIDDKFQTLSSQYLVLKENMEEFHNRSYQHTHSNVALVDEAEHFHTCTVATLFQRLIVLERLNPKLGVFCWKITDIKEIAQEGIITSPKFYTWLHGIPCRLNLCWDRQQKNFDLKFDVLQGDGSEMTENYRMSFDHNAVVSIEAAGKKISRKIYCNDLIDSVQRPVCLTATVKDFISAHDLHQIFHKNTLKCSIKTIYIYIASCKHFTRSISLTNYLQKPLENTKYINKDFNEGLSHTDDRSSSIRNMSRKVSVTKRDHCGICFFGNSL